MPLLLIGILFSKVTMANDDTACNGIWSSFAKSPFIKQGQLREIISPDGKYMIKASKNGLEFISENKSIILDKVIGNPPVTEILWAKDSSKFIINESDGGTVGTWSTHLFYLDKDALPVPIDVQSAVIESVRELAQCDSHEQINMGTIAFSNNNKELFLIAEVPPHSSCKNMGEIAGFYISIASLKIVEQLSQNMIKENWNDYLGCRFITTVNSGHKSKVQKGSD